MKYLNKYEIFDGGRITKSLKKDILNLVAIPITFLTLGLFSLVISIFIVYACDYLVDGFKVSGLVPPLIFSIVLSICNSLVGLFQKAYMWLQGSIFYHILWL